MTQPLDVLPLTDEEVLAMWEANVRAAAEQYLADFDYPTDEGKALAITKLMDEIDKAANAWIESNCTF